LAKYIGEGSKLSVPFFQGLLAEIEAQGDAEGALTRIDEALALAGETGEHWSDAFLHRCRGELLLKRDPANTAPTVEFSEPFCSWPGRVEERHWAKAESPSVHEETHYGHVGRAFLEKLTRDKRDWQAHYDAFKEFIVGGADGQVKRSASKFGLVVMAGELAIE
jgi:hypothetical protein